MKLLVENKHSHLSRAMIKFFFLFIKNERSGQDLRYHLPDIASKYKLFNLISEVGFFVGIKIRSILNILSLNSGYLINSTQLYYYQIINTCISFKTVTKGSMGCEHREKHYNHIYQDL